MSRWEEEESEWSWGESNPRPSGGCRPCYDHSRSRASWLPYRRVGWACAHHLVFPGCQWSFPPSAVFLAVTHRFCCRAAVSRPRVPLLVPMSLYRLTRGQAARANCSSAILVGAPFYESEPLGSRSRPPLLTSKPVSPVFMSSGGVYRSYTDFPERFRADALAMSRSASRAARTWRLSSLRRPRATATSTFTRPSLK